MLQPDNVLRDRRRLDHVFSTIVLETGHLPSRMTVKDVVDIKPTPVTTGGYTEFWRARYKNIDVALSVRRVYNSSRNDEVSEIFIFCYLYYINKVINQRMDGQNLYAEILTLRKLNHSNVIPFLGVCYMESPSSYAIMTPWMEKGNIIEFLRCFPSNNRETMVKC